MSGEVLKINEKDASKSLKVKGTPGPRMKSDNNTELDSGLLGPHSSSLPKGKLEGATSSNISIPTNTSNQNSSHSPDRSEKSSGLTSRLSLKSQSRRKSPVRTQFNLPSQGEPSKGDQPAQDSISAPISSPLQSNTSAAGSNSCKGNTNCAGSSGSPSRSLLRKDRGASASPPVQRAHFAEESCPVSTNPISSIKTEPADPSIPWIPGTSAPISVDRAHSVKITRKILHNWRSACGRTKDKTKDLIRRWKTLPENHPDFEKCPSSPGTSKKKGVSTSSLVNNSGSPGLGKKSDKKAAATSTKSAPPSSVPPNAKLNTSAPPPVEKVKVTVPQIPASPQVRRLNSELQTKSSPVGSSNPSRVSFTPGTRTVDSEMPVVGIGKSIGDGTSVQTNPALGRIGTGMMSGIGRPSVSVNNSVFNGRGSGGDSSGPGSGSSSGPSGGQTKSSTGWTVHVWATYVQRDDLEQGLENEEPKKPDREFLSDFQKVKLIHFFRHVLDMNHDDVISAEDFVALNQRIRHYIEWSSECIEFHILKEVHSGFLECFLNQPLDDCSVMYYCSKERETRQHVNIDEWLDVWGGLLRSARTMESLPLWLQYFPKILFQVINKSGSGTISREELRAFYTMFLGIDFRVVNETLEAIHKAMTDGGRHKITYDLFKLCFANFLLGKYPNGPGQYLFGICSPQTLECSFPIDYSALNTPIDDLEPYDPDKDKSQSNRRSVIV